MPAPSLCTITGTAYNVHGVADADATLDIKQVVLNGVVITSQVEIVRASSLGVMTFALPRGSIAYLYAANIVGFNTRTDGHAVAIPDTPTATLESLLPLQDITVEGVTTSALAVAIAAIGGEKLVASASFNLNSAASQVLYTVSASKRFLLTRTLMRAFTAIPSAGLTNLISINGGASTAHAPSGIGTLTGIDYRVAAGGVYEPVAAAGTVTAMVDDVFGSAATCVIDVYGLLMDA